MLEFAIVGVVDMVVGAAVGWVGVVFDNSSSGVAVLAEEASVGGVFAVVVEEELAQGDGSKAVGFILGNIWARGEVVWVEIVLVIVGGESGDVGLDPALGF